jgi:hypothetical protein
MLVRPENHASRMVTERLQRILRRGTQALVLLFALAQTIAPLLHAHFSDGSGGDSGVHIHLAVSIPATSDDHGSASEIRDFEARILSVPDEYFRDEALRVLDLPPIGGTHVSHRDAERRIDRLRFACVPATAAQPFLKPLPLAPPAPA